MYRNVKEEEFTEKVTEDIQYFVQDVSTSWQFGPKSVLLFPPVNNYRRFLIHKICDEAAFADLSHFSIGYGDHRRTVVCFTKDIIRVPEPIMGIDHHRVPPAPTAHTAEDKKWKVVPAVDIYRPPAARRLSAQQAVAGDVETQKPKSRTRRPDIQVYVPRPKRLSGVRNAVDSAGSPAAMTKNSRLAPGVLEENCSLLPNCIPDSLQSNTIAYTQKNSTKVSNSNDTGTEVCIKTKPARHTGEKNNAQSPQRLDIKSENTNTESTLSNQCANDTVLKTVGPRTFVVDSSDQPSPDCSPTEPVTGAQTVEDSSVGDRLSGSDERNRNVDDMCSLHEMRDVSVDSALERKSKDSSNLNSTDNCATDDKTSETPYGDEILVPFNRKKCEDESRNHEEQNRKNRLIHHGKVISDVLVISDPEPVQDTMPSPAKLGESPPVVLKSKDKPTSVPLVEAEKPTTTSTSPKLSIDDCTWDMMFDENGDCLHPHLMEELTSKVGKVTIKAPRSDYKSFVTRTEFQPNDEFSHVVEIYNFSSEFKTQDLVNIFSAYKDKGFEIKWVDDTHALAVFSSPLIAADVLANEHPFVRTRPLHEATAESRTKARRSSEFLRPYRARPETCPALARRLVTGALGVRLKTAKQEREAEKVLLSQAREKKRLEARQKDDAWEGILGSH